MKHDGRQEDVFIAVDVETAGPSPSEYSLLSLGACLVSDPEQHFYVELQPVTPAMLPEALAIHGLSLERLRDYGLPPADAMREFERWVQSVTPVGTSPVFVALNAPFDWMFVNDYFHRYLRRNPFGYAALDMKAFFMGMAGVPWARANLRTMTEMYGEQETLTHNALDDARDEAILFRKMLGEKVEGRKQKAE
jgi:DNA polymerase III epsilon subunit-like protein